MHKPVPAISPEPATGDGEHLGSVRLTAATAQPPLASEPEGRRTEPQQFLASRRRDGHPESAAGSDRLLELGAEQPRRLDATGRRVDASELRAHSATER